MVSIMVREHGALEVGSTEIPEPKAHEVVVKVRRAGICGSDIHILHGSNPFAVYPRVIGHEFAGEVFAVGAEVTGIRVGDHAVVDPVLSCGDCYPCRIGRSNVCANLQVMGVHRDGGFRDYVAVPASAIISVPADMPFGLAALAEPFSIAANVLSRSGCSRADTVLIYGAGTVGVTVLQVAKLQGARCIVADIDETRLARASAFGADVVINSRRHSVPESVKGEMDGLGPTLVIDGAGIPALLNEACRVASPAGRIGLLGFSPSPSTLSQQDVVSKELTIVGSRLNRRLIPQVVNWLVEGRLKPESMITQVFAATDAREAFDLIEKDPQRTLKVQLEFS
jgi:L-gulonate 5-dehydrogenase